MRLTIKTPTREFEYTARDGAANIVIGNRSYDEICITEDPGISGPHARLEFFIGKWTFSDQFSNTGTIHNGSKKASGELAVGDVLTLGATTFTVKSLGGKADSAAAFSAEPARSAATEMPKQDTAWPPPSEPVSSFAVTEPAEAMAVAAEPLANSPKADDPAALSRQELVDLLYAALVEAAKREDGLDVSDVDELTEYHQLAERGVAGTTPARVALVYAPLLISGAALNFDVEDEMKGELEAEIGDLTPSERKIYDFLLEEANRIAGRQLSTEPLVRERLADAASDADVELNGSNSAEVNVPWLSATDSGPVHLCIKVGSFAGNYRVDATLPPPAMPKAPVVPPAAAPQTLREIMQAKSEAKTEPVDANSVYVVRIEDRLAREFLGKHGTDPRRDASAAKRLREAAHKAVVELEHTKTTTVNLPFLMSDPRGPMHLELEVHRRHLHERAEDEAVPHRTPPSSSIQVGGSAKKGNAGGIAVVVVIIIVSVGAAAFGAITGDETSDAGQQEIQKALEESNRKAKAREDMRKALREATRNDSVASPEQQLEIVAKLNVWAKAENLGLDGEFTSAEKNLHNRVYASLAKRYNAAALDVRLSLDDGKLAEAEAKRAAFMKYVESDPHRASPAETLQIEKWSKERIAEIKADNERLIADKIEDADLALELKDYATAANAIGEIADKAILKGTEKAWLQTEQKVWKALGDQQANGQIDPPLKRRPETPKLPGFPRNDLLPLGGTTAARNLSALRERVNGLFREGKLTEVKTTYRGHGALAYPIAKNSQVRLKVSRAYAKAEQLDAFLEYELTSMIANLPDDAQLGLLWAAPDKTVADWLGLMHFCFDRGFADKAGEAALQVRWADPEHQRELDELLAAKWAKPIPTGGFPERDGRIVPE